MRQQGHSKMDYHCLLFCRWWFVCMEKESALCKLPMKLRSHCHHCTNAVVIILGKKWSTFDLFILKSLSILLLCDNLVVVRMIELAFLYITSQDEDDVTEMELLAK